MVRGIEFVRERSAPGRYIATLNVVFQPDPVKAWLGEAGVKIAETVSRAGAGHPAVEGQGGRRAARRPQCLARSLAGARHGRAAPCRSTVLRGDQLDQNAVTAEEALCRRRLGARPAERALSRADHRRGDRRGRQGRRPAHRRRPALRHADRRAQRDPAHDGRRTRPSSPTRPSRSTPKIDEQWRSVATVRRDSQDTIDVYVPIRALGDWVQVRQRLGGVPALKSVVVRQLESDRAELQAGIFRHHRRAAAHAGLGRAGARQGSRQVAIAGALIAYAGAER